MAIIGSLASGGMKPTTPTIGTASDGGTGTSASVAFTASSYIGKGTITYTATSSPGSITGTGSSSPITVSGLTTGTAYTFTVSGTTNYGVASASSAASNSVTPATPTSYESIASATGTGSSNTITFSSIPSTYKHLQIRIMSRATSGGNNIQLTLNSDTGANYARHNLGGNGSIVFSNGDASQNYISFDDFTTTSSDGADTMGAGIIDIYDYSSSTKNKTLRGFGGRDNNGSGNIKLHSGLWINTSAISSITLTHSGSNFSSSSVFSLYGIKGA